jgi:hypothetical protein
MFRQVIAIIIRGVVVPWKLLRQDLYCGCILITIRPVWLVVGGCSCSLFFETLVTTHQTARCYSPEDDSLHVQHLI